MATHSSILAWRIPWTEEPGRLQSTGSQRVRHDRATFFKRPLTQSGLPKFPRFLSQSPTGTSTAICILSPSLVVLIWKLAFCKAPHVIPWWHLGYTENRAVRCFPVQNNSMTPSMGGTRNKPHEMTCTGSKEAPQFTGLIHAHLCTLRSS